MLTHCANTGGEVSGAAVAQIVAIDRGDDDIAQAHRLNSTSQVGGFVRIKRIGTTMCHIAKRTATRADIAHDHEGCGAMPEALAQIRATGFFAHCVQMIIP